MCLVPSSNCINANSYIFVLFCRNISLAEPIAEFMGTMVLVLIGTSGNAQGVLFNNPNVSTASAGVSPIFLFRTSFGSVIRGPSPCLRSDAIQRYFRDGNLLRLGGHSVSAWALGSQVGPAAGTSIQL